MQLNLYVNETLFNIRRTGHKMYERIFITVFRNENKNFISLMKTRNWKTKQRPADSRNIISVPNEFVTNSTTSTEFQLKIMKFTTLLLESVGCSQPDGMKALAPA